MLIPGRPWVDLEKREDGTWWIVGIPDAPDAGPYDRKAEFSQLQIEPNLVEIPLDTHIGQPATPVCAVGDLVRRGDVIASVDNIEQLGCPVHASIEGHVASVSTQSVVITRQ